VLKQRNALTEAADKHWVNRRLPDLRLHNTLKSAFHHVLLRADR
jgi:hypothetical protein